MADQSTLYESFDRRLNKLGVEIPSVGEIDPDTIGSGSIVGSVSRSSNTNESAVFIDGSEGWQLGSDGIIRAVGVILSGSITATSGAIGGFSITTTSISSTGLLLTSGASASLAFGTIPPTGVSSGTGIYLDKTGLFGLSSNTQNFKLDATNGSITSIAGTIGGWTLGTTTLSATSILLDAGNQKIESTNYVSGAFGSGFHLDSNLLEVGNIACRGLIRTAVFQKDVVSVMGGSFAVLDGDVLNTDMTTLDNSTLTTRGTTTFAVGDILRIKDGTDDEWFEITDTSSAPTYIVTRDKASVYGANTNPQWKKGATVVNYKSSGDGGIYMTASDTNAPYLSIFDHAGSPWSTITTRLRIGNLNGYLGYSSDLYGIGIGAVGNSMSYDVTNGMRITGTITGGTVQTAATGERVVMTSNKIYTYDSSDNITAYLNGYSTYGSILYLKNFTYAVCPFRVDNEVDANYCATFNNNSATTGVGVLTSMLDADNTGSALSAAQNGLGYAGYFYSNLVSHASNVVGIFNDSTNSATTNLYSELTSTSSTGYAEKVLHKGTSGYGLWLECSNASMAGCSLYAKQVGTNSTCAVFEATGGNCIATVQNTTVSTNFKKQISLGGTVIWWSNSTTPNGNLSGNAGDICLNADSGKAYYCTGTTNWTAM